VGQELYYLRVKERADSSFELYRILHVNSARSIRVKCWAHSVRYWKKWTVASSDCSCGSQRQRILSAFRQSRQNAIAEGSFSSMGQPNCLIISIVAEDYVSCATYKSCRKEICRRNRLSCADTRHCCEVRTIIPILCKICTPCKTQKCEIPVFTHVLSAKWRN
jgi:hypothetical protein